MTDHTSTKETPNKFRPIFKLWMEGRDCNEIAGIVDLAPDTVRDYIAKCESHMSKDAFTLSGVLDQSVGNMPKTKKQDR